MDRRAWLKLAGSSLAAGLTGCGGGVTETRVPTVNRRLVASYGGAGFGIWQDGRLLDSPLLVDDGKVRKVRWIPLKPGQKLPVDDIAILIAEAVALRS